LAGLAEVQILLRNTKASEPLHFGLLLRIPDLETRIVR